MIGAIIGDVVGSRFEFNNLKSKKFEFLAEKCTYTDDTVMTIAIAKSFLEWDFNEYSKLSELAVKNMRELGLKYPDLQYGNTFYYWLRLPKESALPYNSFGNGSAMRASACGWCANSVEDAIRFADAVTMVTHNHEEGIKGARVVSLAIYLARHGCSKAEIKALLDKFYPVNFTLNSIRDDYEYDVTCQGSVPQALECFYEGSSYEDVVRNAVSIGGDSDTVACIAGSVAEAFYGISDIHKYSVRRYLDEYMLNIVDKFTQKFINK